MQIAKIKLKNHICDGIAKRDHCKLVVRVVCVSEFEKQLLMIHCGHFMDVKYIECRLNEMRLIQSIRTMARLSRVWNVGQIQIKMSYLVMSSTGGRSIIEGSMIVISDQLGRVDMQIYTRIYVCHSVLIDLDT